MAHFSNRHVGQLLITIIMHRYAGWSLHVLPKRLTVITLQIKFIPSLRHFRLSSLLGNEGFTFDHFPRSMPILNSISRIECFKIISAVNPGSSVRAGTMRCQFPEECRGLGVPLNTKCFERGHTGFSTNFVLGADHILMFTVYGLLGRIRESNSGVIGKTVFSNAFYCCNFLRSAKATLASVFFWSTSPFFFVQKKKFDDEQQSRGKRYTFLIDKLGWFGFWSGRQCNHI